MSNQLSKIHIGLLFVSAFLFASVETWASRDGEAVYKAECTTCHTSGAERMPTLQTLKAMPTETIVQSLESGIMRIIGTFNLNGPERIAVAEYITGKRTIQVGTPISSANVLTKVGHRQKKEKLLPIHTGMAGVTVLRTRAFRMPNTQSLIPKVLKI